MLMTPEDAAAHIEIQQVIFRYCRGVDRGDAALIASVYHPDAVDEHGAWRGLGREFGDYLVPAMDQTPLVSQHHITNSLIALAGDTAQVESYFIAFHGEADGAGGHRHAQVCGRYLDRFERRDGGWKIAHRQVILDLSRVLATGEAWGGMDHFPHGGRRDADPSWDRFAVAVKPA
jgi:ketosteroid isomerase-like protein